MNLRGRPSDPLRNRDPADSGRHWRQAPASRAGRQQRTPKSQHGHLAEHPSQGWPPAVANLTDPADEPAISSPPATRRRPVRDDSRRANMTGQLDLRADCDSAAWSTQTWHVAPPDLSCPLSLLRRRKVLQTPTLPHKHRRTTTPADCHAYVLI
jgi:hypothetical protein